MCAVAGTWLVSASPMTLICSRMAESWSRRRSRSSSVSASRASSATWSTVLRSMLIANPILTIDGAFQSSSGREAGCNGAGLVAYLEIAELSGSLAPGVASRLHVGALRPATQIGEEALQQSALALGNHQHGAVGLVAGVAGESQRLRS